MTDTQRRVALVTGAAQGLGLGTARALAEKGFDVAVSDLHEPNELTRAVIDEISALGVTARYYTLDIADLDRHIPVLEQVAADFGRIDSLINNAGIAARPLTDILELSPEAFDRSVDINLRGTFFLTQAFANLVIERGWATPDSYVSVLIVSSIAAEMVSTERAQYNVTKAALSMTTKLYAQRLASENIYVHEIRPGFMQTAMTASAGNTIVDDWINEGRVPIARWGQAEDVGRCIATLANGEMPYMTGQPFWVAGGLNVPPAP